MSSESLVGREMVNGYLTSFSHTLLFTLLPNHNFPFTTPTFKKKKKKLYQHIKYTQSLSSLCCCFFFFGKWDLMPQFRI